VSEGKWQCRKMLGIYGADINFSEPLGALRDETITGDWVLTISDNSFTNDKQRDRHCQTNKIIGEFAITLQKKWQRNP